MFIDVKIPRKVQLEFQNLQPESFSVSLEEEDQEVQMLYFQSILFAHLFLVHLFFLFCFFFSADTKQKCVAPNTFNTVSQD